MIRTIIIAVLLFLSLPGIALLIGAVIAFGEAEDIYREMDDDEQEEYLRQWMEDHHKKMNRRK